LQGFRIAKKLASQSDNEGLVRPELTRDGLKTATAQYAISGTDIPEYR
jgi:hypothetical protein